MYVCTYIYIYIYTCTHVHKYIYIYVCIYIYIYKNIHIYTWLTKYRQGLLNNISGIYIYIYVYTYIHIIYIYIYVYTICICIYMGHRIPTRTAQQHIRWEIQSPPGRNSQNSAHYQIHIVKSLYIWLTRNSNKRTFTAYTNFVKVSSLLKLNCKITADLTFGKFYLRALQRIQEIVKSQLIAETAT